MDQFFTFFSRKTDISHQILSKINLQHVVGRWIAHICSFSSWKLTSLTLFVFDGWPFFKTSSSLFFHWFALRRNSQFGLTKIAREFSKFDRNQMEFFLSLAHVNWNFFFARRVSNKFPIRCFDLLRKKIMLNLFDKQKSTFKHKCTTNEYNYWI